uniref:Glypican-1 n=1 Tax=Callithrix jacchus TaxID=9483 RepID=A0A8I3WBP0_CALJA
MELRARGWWLLCAAAAVVACARGDPASKSRSCSEVRQIYGAKGFSLSDVPQAEISGEHLRICPQGYTCCTSEMEENLANRSRTELETSLRDSSRALQAMLATQLRSFDDHFQHLLNDSERALQDAFPGAFGELYAQNARAFRDLYSELRLYYRGANLHLEETLAEFWARLLERLFKQLHPQLLLPDDYLDCLGKQAEALRPFGEAPRELRLRATRAFVAARSFVQGLGVASDVVRKVAQVPLGPECSRAVMKLVYCAHCLGVPGARPCPDYCRNVLKGCLANQADLDAEWRNLLDSMVLITDKFWGASGVESVIGGVHMWLAEAINSLQDNRDTLTAKVIQGCGNPKVNPQGPGPEEKRRRGKLAPRERPPSGTLEKLVSEAKAQLRDIQDFWISLPGTLCSEKMALSTASDDRCWNGMARGRYLPEVMGDGLANQINNPEVEEGRTQLPVHAGACASHPCAPVLACACVCACLPVRVGVRMCVSMCAGVCIGVCVCMPVHWCVRWCVNVHWCVSWCVRWRVYACVPVCACAPVCALAYACVRPCVPACALVCAYACMCTSVCIGVCMRAYVCVHVCQHVHWCVHMRACALVCACIRMCVCESMCAGVCTGVCIGMWVCMHVCRCACVCVRVLEGVERVFVSPDECACCTLPGLGVRLWEGWSWRLFEMTGQKWAGERGGLRGRGWSGSAFAVSHAVSSSMCALSKDAGSSEVSVPRAGTPLPSQKSPWGWCRSRELPSPLACCRQRAGRPQP